MTRYVCISSHPEGRRKHKKNEKMTTKRTEQEGRISISFARGWVRYRAICNLQTPVGKVGMP